jgi:predicted kinase
VLESDALRKRRYGRPTYSNDESAALFRHLRRVAVRNVVQGRSVIIDATNMSEWERQPYYRIAAAYGARLEVVRLIAPEPLIRERLLARSAGNGGVDNSDAGTEVYELMLGRWQDIAVPHRLVDSSVNIIPAVEAVAKAMEAR